MICRKHKKSSIFKKLVKFDLFQKTCKKYGFGKKRKSRMFLRNMKKLTFFEMYQKSRKNGKIGKRYDFRKATIKVVILRMCQKACTFGKMI